MPKGLLMAREGPREALNVCERLVPFLCAICFTAQYDALLRHLTSRSGGEGQFLASRELARIGLLLNASSSLLFLFVLPLICDDRGPSNAKGDGLTR